MAKSIMVNSQEVNNNGIRLDNGDIITVEYSDDHKVLVLMVTSFRYPIGVRPQNIDPKIYQGSYCSLLNLETGFLMFDERCSRHTTIERVCNHLNNPNKSKHKYVVTGTFKQYKKDQFSINIRTE
jgi:hypothetical protein